jgi:hypothetical protein
MEVVFEVQDRLGPGVSDEIHQNALIAELEMLDISFLNATGLRLGFLLSFGERQIEYVRIAN